MARHPDGRRRRLVGRGLRAPLRRVRAPARSPVSRPGLSGLLVRGSPSHAAAVHSLRRAASVVARDQPRRARLPALPPPTVGHRPWCVVRRPRRPPARHRPRVQIRPARIAFAATCATAPRTLRWHSRRCGPCRAGSAPLASPSGPRLQPGRGAGAAPRAAGGGRPPTPATHRASGRAAGVAPSRQRARSVCVDPPRACEETGPEPVRRPGGRRDDDRGHPRELRAPSRRGGSPRGAGAHRGTSTLETAVATSAATAARSRSPSISTQPGPDDCRR